jgi:hypothetical protein
MPSYNAPGNRLTLISSCGSPSVPNDDNAPHRDAVNHFGPALPIVDAAPSASIAPAPSAAAATLTIRPRPRRSSVGASIVIVVVVVVLHPMPSSPGSNLAFSSSTTRIVLLNEWNESSETPFVQDPEMK